MLTDKTREEQFQVWKKRLKVAKDLHKEKVIDWADKVFKEYAGESDVNMDTGEKYIRVAQVIHGIEETIQPHLMYQNPTINAKAKKPEWEKRESLVSAVVNHEYNDIKASGHKIELENELVILDARLLPFGCTETCWDVKGEILEEEPEEGVLDKAKGLLTGSKPEMIKTPVIEKEEHITERVNPLEVFLDYSASHITKQKFTIRKKDVRKSDLLMPKYDQDKVKNLNPTAALLPDKYGVKNNEKITNDPDFKGYRLYEIEDLENRVIHTMCEGYEDFIEFNTPHPLPEGSKYSFLWFKEIPNSVYPEAPIKFYRKRAYEYSYILSQVSEQIDKFMPKIGFDVNRLHAPDKERFKSGGLGAMIGFDGSPDGAMKEISPSVNPDLFKYMAMTKELINLESGASEHEISMPDEDRTATQDNLIQKGVRARRFKPQKRVRDFIINQAHKIWQTLAVNAEAESFVKVLGESDSLEWWQDPETGKNSWNREDIAGDYQFDFDVESLSPLDKRARMAINNEALDRISNPALAQKVMSEGNELLITPILEKIASDNWGMKDKSKIIRKMNFLEPGEEHDLFMQGHGAEITEREQKDPMFLIKHFQAHDAWIKSPAFKFLPPEIQGLAVQHYQTYAPLIQKMQSQQPNSQGHEAGGSIKKNDMSTPQDEPFAPVPMDDMA